MCILDIYIYFIKFYFFTHFPYLFIYFFCGTITKYSVGEHLIIFHTYTFSKNMTRRKLKKLDF